jgi:hypothetical protein
MAAGLGYKEFTTGDVLTAADANGYLASQVVMVFASAAARTSAIASPQEGMISYLKDTNSTEYYSGSAWAAIGAGGGGGKVLQVVQGTTSTSTTIATTTYTDTTLTATITPSAATSKILVITMQNYTNYAATNAAYSAIKLLRGATDVYVSPSNFGLGGTYAAGATAVESRGTSSIVYLDSPSTTSATTYKTQARPENTASSQNVIFQQSANPSTIVLLEIGA